MGDPDGYGDSAPEDPRATGRPVIVGIGASAGGIQALQAFFEGLPSDCGAAFVVVVHLAPQHQSELPGILAGRTRMPVTQVANIGSTEPLQKNHVYVIPPDRRLYITDHKISAAAFDEPRGQRAPIDLFFRSLAEAQDDSFAVILTGAGSDGAIGIRAIKEAGGVILVQDPNEAEYPSMPRSAIATGVADFVLPIRDLAARLSELVRTSDVPRSASDHKASHEALRRILAHVRVRTGHDFSRYKRSTVMRRIARRMQVTRTASLPTYYDYLQENPEEAQALLSDLLISVTTFFRDGAAFDAVKQHVLPHLFERKEAADAVRIWLPGCATGEEAYSIAMLLIEEAGRHDIRPTLQVFASDLDARALSVAREGRYPTTIEANISDERLRRFFTREGDHYRVRGELRDVVLFAGHNLLKDPPFSRIDLISCRNLLIYLDRELQQQVCSTFHYALNGEGFLFLGTSESADVPPGLFRVVDRQWRIYRSTLHPGEKRRLLPSLVGGLGRHETGAPPIRPPSPSALLSEAASHRRAIETLAPPSILVDDAHRVVHLSEHAGRYLQPSGGPLSGDIVDLVRLELRFELRSALNRVFEQRQTTLTLPILVRFNGSPHRLHLQVKPADESEHLEPRHALILFIEGEAIERPPDSVDSGHDSDEIVRRLREELEVTQARLRTTREESEAANEELRAANEELQSINEEYRSTSEELETSKEELQSINEELQTVNVELKLKLDAVSRAHSDLQNLMAATDFGTLFLDSSLRIKRFTDQVTDLFRLTLSDEGRPITDFAHQLDYDDLIKDAQTVLQRLTPIRREALSRSGHWYDVRLRPYRTVEDKIDGVVITFVDISERRQIEEALRESELRLRREKRLVELSRDPIFIWDFDDGIVLWNRGSEELYGYSREEALGRVKDQLLSTEVEGSSSTELRTMLLAEGSWSGEHKHRTKSGRVLTIESRILLEEIDGKRLALESTRDITERKRWEERQQLLLRELTHRVKNSLAIVQSIAYQTLRNAPSHESFIDRFDGRLLALSGAHNLLVDANWEGADLESLIRFQLEPFAMNHADRVQLAGTTVSLAPHLATSFSLVLHELATNAVKYGALSNGTGKIHVAWSLAARNGQRTLTMEWRETEGPHVTPPKKTGFGSVLIDTGLPDATVRREFLPAGLVCTIQMPLPEPAAEHADV